jgi:hypothetical protein
MFSLKKSAIVLLIIGFVILGIEYSARYLGCPQPYSALFGYDEKLGYRPPISRQITFPAGRHIYTVTFDENGIADRAGEGDGEVVILGDGVTAGLELRPQDRMAYQMSRLLANKSVVNLSVTGYGTIQQALLLEEWLAAGKIKPKTVFLVFNLSNDPIDDTREWDGSSVPNVSLNDSGRGIQPPILPGKPYRIAAELWRNSVLAGCYVNYMRPEVLRSTASSPHLVTLVKYLRATDQSVALAGSKAGLVRLQELGKTYGFRIYASFWQDQGELVSLDPSDRLFLIERIKSLAPNIIWLNGVINADSDSLGEWDKKYLIPGVRHANQHALLALSKSLSARLAEK